MSDESKLKHRIENHGLIAIALGLILIYWIFDSMVTDQFLLRLLVVALIATYSVLTQHLINTRKDAEVDLKKSQDAFVHQMDMLKSEINQLKKSPTS